MTVLANSPVRSQDIDFSPLSATEWRITDAKHPKNSIEALLGFVAHHGGVFYVTRMNHPLESTPFGSLEQVASFLRAAGLGES
jgi:hypothetical protein